MQWAVFEPNDQNLWAKIKLNITAFLTTVWRSGALFGSTPEEAFYVKCDAETDPPELRELGQVVTEIGVAVVRPAEFVIFRIEVAAAAGRLRVQGRNQDGRTGRSRRRASTSTQKECWTDPARVLRTGIPVFLGLITHADLDTCNDRLPEDNRFGVVPLAPDSQVSIVRRSSHLRLPAGACIPLHGTGAWVTLRRTSTACRICGPGSPCRRQVGPTRPVPPPKARRHRRCLRPLIHPHSVPSRSALPCGRSS